MHFLFLNKHDFIQYHYLDDNGISVSASGVMEAGRHRKDPEKNYQ